jgi:spore coat polysaccharide biosynthesis protein SpsF
MKEKTGIIIQARMSSKRFPGKSLKPLAGIPLIGHVIRRMKRVQDADVIILATSNDQSDDALAAFAEKEGARVFRGDLANVQKRFLDAALFFGIERIVRVTGDNPFISPELIDEELRVWDEKKPDYIGYRTCVYGIGAEVFSLDALHRACARPPDPYEQEHVTPAFYRDQKNFRAIALDAAQAFCDTTLRLTVDTEEDRVRAEALFKKYVDIHGYVELTLLIAGERKRA